jgi:hypothetical protein
LTGPTNLATRGRLPVLEDLPNPLSTDSTSGSPDRREAIAGLMSGLHRFS